MPLKSLKKVCKNQLGPSTKAIVDAAERRKIPIIKIGKDSIIQLGYGKYQRIQATIVNTSCIAVDIACDKTTTKLLLDEVEFQYLKEAFANITASSKYGRKIGYPVVKA